MNKKGFTLIEVLLVVMIIGFMLSVILPRGLRATTDAKYNLVRQNCVELASYGNDWVEQQMLAQDADSTALRSDYLASLVERSNQLIQNDNGAWIAGGTAGGGLRSNWNSHATLGYNRVRGRNMNNVPNSQPENSVEEIIDPSKLPRNPFNGANIFNPSNYPATSIVPGAIGCSVAQDQSTGGTFDYYAFIFQGTDSTLYHPGNLQFSDFHAGMAHNDLGGLREGVFFAKARPQQ